MCCWERRLSGRSLYANQFCQINRCQHYLQLQLEVQADKDPDQVVYGLKLRFWDHSKSSRKESLESDCAKNLNLGAFKGACANDCLRSCADVELIRFLF